MTYAVHHVLTLLAALLGARVMLRSPRAWRAPRTSLLIWQAIALTLVSSLVGVLLAAGLAPYRLGVLPALARLCADLARGGPPAAITAGHLALVGGGLAVAGWLLAALVRTVVSVAALRRRQRSLLGLIAVPHPSLAGALVVDHPVVAAYCLPGRRPAIVVSTGSVGLLSEREMDAVLAHERAHARERHDLMILPFSVLHRALPAGRLTRAMLDAVALLVEMRADDRAAREHPRATLASALRRFHACDRPVVAPPGALGGGGPHLRLRIDRLTEDRLTEDQLTEDQEPITTRHRVTGTAAAPAAARVLPSPAPAVLTALAVVTAMTVVSTPLSLFLLPL
ncbi:M56 family metallopeptidase [Nonomuraea sp. NN258]|uniref:M56 family metallopeptidase n=1 Tax=Nonomuraea antri TaxID=2730852 RepID=UPI00156A6B05|nr:M56 family metallopeptidase [Nonomuraea antri]NRQ36696.1 M56 family metallopeptidase [Nonomuraea antri]